MEEDVRPKVDVNENEAAASETLEAEVGRRFKSQGLIGVDSHAEKCSSH